MEKETKKNDHDGSRTRNLSIRSRTPYPLGHAAGRYVQPVNLLYLNKTKLHIWPAASWVNLL